MNDYQTASQSLMANLEKQNGINGSLSAINELMTGFNPEASLLPPHRQAEQSPDKAIQHAQALQRWQEKSAEFDGIEALAFDAYQNGDKATKEALQNGFSSERLEAMNAFFEAKKKYGVQTEQDDAQIIPYLPKKSASKIPAPQPKPSEPIKQTKNDDLFSFQNATLKRLENGQYTTDNALLNAIMKIESGGRADAVSPTGARGLFQFTKGTGKQYGLMTNADRLDPIKNYEAMKRLTADNIKALQRAGIEPTPANIYMAHQQGIGGTIEIIRAIKQGREVSAKVRKNMNLNAGKGKTPAQFYAMFEAKINKNLGLPMSDTAVPVSASVSSVPTSPAYVPTIQGTTTPTAPTVSVNAVHTHQPRYATAEAPTYATANGIEPVRGSPTDTTETPNLPSDMNIENSRAEAMARLRSLITEPTDAPIRGMSQHTQNILRTIIEQA